MNENKVITVEKLRKAYGEFVAVDDVSFTVERGEIFSLLGPNGAGKTSTLESLEGLRLPDSGTIRIMGIDPTREARQLRSVIGVQLQSSGLPETIQPDEAMRLFCAYLGVAPRYDLLERLGLGQKRSTQYFALSTGQKRRLALALAVAHDPPVLFLDEPTAGLDVTSRAELHRLMRELQTAGTTIVLATHDMAEVEKLADRAAILLHGKLVAMGSPHQLTMTGEGLTKISVRTVNATLTTTGFTFPTITRQSVQDEYTLYYSSDPGPAVAALIAHLERMGDKLIDLRVERPSLEERFLELTNEEPI